MRCYGIKDCNSLLLFINARNYVCLLIEYKVTDVDEWMVSFFSFRTLLLKEMECSGKFIGNSKICGWRDYSQEGTSWSEPSFVSRQP